MNHLWIMMIWYSKSTHCKKNTKVNMKTRRLLMKKTIVVMMKNTVRIPCWWRWWWWWRRIPWWWWWWWWWWRWRTWTWTWTASKDSRMICHKMSQVPPRPAPFSTAVHLQSWNREGCVGWRLAWVGACLSKNLGIKWEDGSMEEDGHDESLNHDVFLDHLFLGW